MARYINDITGEPPLSEYAKFIAAHSTNIIQHMDSWYNDETGDSTFAQLVVQDLPHVNVIVVPHFIDKTRREEISHMHQLLSDVAEDGRNRRLLQDIAKSQGVSRISALKDHYVEYMLGHATADTAVQSFDKAIITELNRYIRTKELGFEGEIPEYISTPPR